VHISDESAQNYIQNNTQFVSFFSTVSIFLFLVLNLKKSTKLKKEFVFFRIEKKVDYVNFKHKPRLFLDHSKNGRKSFNSTKTGNMSLLENI
jgi:hypothetical protein